jgi:ER-bound oxygenase mpaB/B'/Rubber oxygenase, catalytic domain
MGTEDRIPSEFRYFENLSKPAVQKARKRFRLFFGFDPLPPEDTVRAWARSYYDADPVAEAFVEEVYLEKGQAAGRAFLDAALERGVDSIPDAPASLVRLMGEIEKRPAWVDWDRVKLGARVFRRYGPHMYSFAGSITLEGYQENSVAKPLAFTGAYNGESAQRRFLETAAFWIDVSSDGALEKGGIGIKTALRVRMMHVFVRKRLLRHPNWNVDAWGVPISQGDAILTLLAGSTVAGLALKTIGYRTSKEEIEAMMHFWRYVGHIMGVQPSYYPETMEDALRVIFAASCKGVFLAGEDGKQLAHSYVQSYAPKKTDDFWTYWRKTFEYNLELGYTRHFLPGKTFRKYGLPSAGLWQFHPLAQFPLLFAAETLRRRHTFVDDLMDEFAQWRSRRWLAQNLGARSAEYRAVETFTR